MSTYQRWARIVVITMTVALLLPYAACWAESSQSDPVKLKIVLMPYLSFAAFFIAEEEGYFSEQGLEIEFVSMGKESEPLPALIQGALDVGVSGVDIGVFNAIDRGARLKIVADKGYYGAGEACPAHALLARRALVESGELSQLKGRRVVVEPLTSEGYYFERLLHEAGLTFDDIHIEDVPQPILSKAFESGALDIAYVAEPWITRIVQTGHAVLWKNVEAALPEFQAALILYGPNLLDTNPETGRSFMTAYLKAVQQYNEGKTDRNVEILAKYTKLDPELLRKTCWPALKKDGSINVQSIIDFQTWSKSKGTLDSNVTQEQFWDDSFIKYGNQILGTPSK